MEDFIPFLLAIAYIVFTLYKRGNKAKQKKEQQQTETIENEREVSTEQPDFKKVFEEILIGREPEPEQEVYKEESKEAESIEATGKEVLEQITDEEEVHKAEMEKKKKEVAKVEKAEVNIFEEEEETAAFEFDLKKAVIFSEILRRPYF